MPQTEPIAAATYVSASPIARDFVIRYPERAINSIRIIAAIIAKAEFIKPFTPKVKNEYITPLIAIAIANVQSTNFSLKSVTVIINNNDNQISENAKVKLIPNFIYDKIKNNIVINSTSGY